MEDNNILKSGSSNDQDVLLVRPFENPPFQNADFLNHTHNGVDSPLIFGQNVRAAGNNTEIQFNDNGSFGADPNFTWDKTVGQFTALPTNGFDVENKNEHSGTVRLIGGSGSEGNTGGQITLGAGAGDLTTSGTAYLSDKVIDPLVNQKENLTRTSNGNLHFCFGRQNGSNYELVYSSSNDNGKNWIETVIDTSIQSSNTTIAMVADNADNLHVVYSAGTGVSLVGALRYRKFTGTWSSATVLVSGINLNPQFPSIAVDSSNNIYVVYSAFDAVHTNVYFTAFTGSWSVPARINALTFNHGTTGSSLAVDLSDNLHITFGGENAVNTNGFGYYQTYSGSWSAVTTITTSYAAAVPACLLAIDSNEFMHVAIDKPGGGIDYVTNITGAWITTPQVVNVSGGGLQISIDGNDIIFIIYGISTSFIYYSFKLASSGATTWTTYDSGLPAAVQYVAVSRGQSPASAQLASGFGFTYAKTATDQPYDYGYCFKVFTGGNGGDAYLYSGDGALTGDGNGGDVFITAGQGTTGEAGDIILRVKTGTQNGKFVFIPKNGTGARGILNFDLLTTSNKTFTFPDQSGTLALTSGTSLPSDPNTSIQFNNGGSFGGSELLYSEPDISNAIIQIKNQDTTNNAGVTLTIKGSNGNGSSAGGRIDIVAGSAEGETFGGGELNLGAVASTGGAQTSAFTGAYGIDGNGGDVLIQAGGKGGGGVNNGNLILGDPDAYGAIIDTSLTTAYRTFTFPDASGVVALQGLLGTKVYYVSDTSGGPVTRKLTFINGILTSET